MARKNAVIFSRKTFMYDGKIFARRVKLLRTIHKLSQEKLGNLISSPAAKVGRSSIGYWEAQKRFPRIAALQKLTNLFAVSLDWISGRSDTPYDEALILALEKDLFPLVIPVQGNGAFVAVPCAAIQVPEEYTDEQRRCIYYSLGVRANIVFWLNCLKYDIISRSLIIKKHDSNTGNLCLKFSELSPDLMVQHDKLFVPKSKPIWDLEEKRKILKKL